MQATSVERRSPAPLAATARGGAVRLYPRIARAFPGHSFADDALFFAADLLVRMGRPEDARDALATLVREHPGGDYRAEARFKLAWLARRLGDADAAAAQLLAIEEEERGDPYEHARAAYWRARVLAGGGEAGRAAAKWFQTGTISRWWRPETLRAPQSFADAKPVSLRHLLPDFFKN